MIRRAALLLPLLTALPSAGRAGEGIVLVPFEAVARTRSARAVVMPEVERALAARDYVAVPGEAVEAFLHRERIRYLDSIPTSKLGELLEELNAGAAVLGAILTWDAGGADPRVALAARLVDRDGSVLWSGVAGLSAAETEGLLGLGKVEGAEALANRVTARLFESLPRGHPGDHRPGRPPRSVPRVFRSPAALGRPLRICVLPLENRGEAREAPRVVEALLLHHLRDGPGITVVSPADLRASVVSAGLRAPSQLSLEQLRALSAAVGTSLFLRGAILGYGARSAGGEGTPEVELHLTLLDAESGRTLWSGLHRRSGLDYEGLLQRGAVREPASLASQVVAELVGAFTRP